TELVVAPMLEESGRLCRDLPLALRQGPPSSDSASDFTDEVGGLVLLSRGRETLPLIEDECLLRWCDLPFLGRRDRRNEVGPAAFFDHPLRWLAVGVQLPVPLWFFVGRVKDRMIKKGIRRNCVVHHQLVPSPSSIG